MPSSYQRLRRLSFAAAYSVRNMNLLALAVKSFSAAVIFVSTILTVYTVGPGIETYFFPVVSKLTIEKMEAIDDGSATVDAYFTKLRNCEYIGIAWYRGQRDGGFARVPLVLTRAPGDDSSPNRPVGAQRSGPWLVSMPVSEIKANSFVELKHQCHPFWVTTTEFYP